MVHLSEETMEPDAEHQKTYEERFQTFKELYPANRKLMDGRRGR